MKKLGVDEYEVEMKSGKILRYTNVIKAYGYQPNTRFLNLKGVGIKHNETTGIIQSTTPF